jgi:DNA-binding beta-propeller fold protein YncE
VADFGNDRIQKFSPAGRLVGQLRSESIIGPTGVAVDKRGHVYVLAEVRVGGGLSEFSPTGRMLHNWLPPALALDGAAVDGKGGVYVAIHGPDAIVKLASDLTPDTSWGTKGRALDGQIVLDRDLPTGVAVDEQGNIYVAATGQDRIAKLTSSGQVVTMWGTHGSGPGQLDHPTGLAVDTKGNVYVADTYNNRVQEFSSTGDFLAQWGGIGIAPGQFQVPEGVAVDGAGSLYVVDSINARVQVFTPASSI